ncbi:hypothetical protein M8C21_009221 [Ambrosia artemisiifolia]|uniref:Auxin-responsive protein n=1 Tax=Ambrosia artemisiifolia TaxID=4212 RepID=A0AAD5D2T5_AMBAR|nr:hypothetical protein M8C21_009221 [Ambrosia artemisiifolia]
MEPQGLELEITELRLGLPGGNTVSGSGCEKKTVFSGGAEADVYGGVVKSNADMVVGWPPVCLYRQKSMGEVTKRIYVKVSMDGAPILRKVDLSCLKGYVELGMALEKLFGCYGIVEAMKEESESCEHIAIYEDKDGDWMLVGDVPWL